MVDTDFFDHKNKTNYNFNKLIEIANFPDIGSYFHQNKCELSSLLKLRNSEDNQVFRKWFHETINNLSHSENIGQDIAKEYIKILEKTEEPDKIPAKILRFAWTQGIGIINTPAGILLSAADSFLGDKAFHRPSPKFFIQNLKRKLQ